jgi:hypothetical protein
VVSRSFATFLLCCVNGEAIEQEGDNYFGVARCHGFAIPCAIRQPMKSIALARSRSSRFFEQQAGKTFNSSPTLFKTLFECRETGLTFWIVRRPVHEYADTPRLLDLLCARNERPCAAEQYDELSPPHSITSSARARSDDGTVRPSAFAVETIKNTDVPSETRKIERSMEGYSLLAQNEDWLADNFDKIIRSQDVLSEDEALGERLDSKAVAKIEEHVLRCLGAAVMPADSISKPNMTATECSAWQSSSYYGAIRILPLSSQ